MRLLLDTHIIIALINDRDGPRLPAPMLEMLSDPANSLAASVASAWEAAIKHRLGKLPLPCPLSQWSTALRLLGIYSYQISTAHAVRELDPWPETNDPFDRLLLAVADAERLQLVTLDEQLADHPLAWRA